MTFQFIAPRPEGRVSDMTITAPNLHEALNYFEMKYWCGPGAVYGVWHGDALIAYVSAVCGRDGKPPRPICVPVTCPSAGGNG